jgi:hypothetical protein
MMSAASSWMAMCCMVLNPSMWIYDRIQPGRFFRASA